MTSIERLQGKSLQIDKMQIETIDEQLILSLDTSVCGKAYRIICRNVSALTMDSFSYPMQICGAAITDHSSEGWQADRKYEVYDFEDGKIRFFCEEIVVWNL